MPLAKLPCQRAWANSMMGRLPGGQQCLFYFQQNRLEAATTSGTVLDSRFVKLIAWQRSNDQAGNRSNRMLRERSS